MPSIHRRPSAIGLILGVALSLILILPAAAREVSHGTYRSTVAQVVWGDSDPVTGAGTWGILAAYDQDSFSGISYTEQTASLVDCGGYQGLVGTFRSGEAFDAVTIDVAPNLSTGRASGLMTVVSGTFDECTWEFVVTSVEENVAVSLDLVAAAGRENTIDRYVEQLPDEYRAMSVTRMQIRPAAGSASIGGEPLAFDAAAISKHSSSFHFHGQ